MKHLKFLDGINLMQVECQDVLSVNTHSSINNKFLSNRDLSTTLCPVFADFYRFTILNL